MRAEGTCGNTVCESITISVGAGVDNPTAALVLTNNLCPGQSTNLEVVGPALPTDYIYVWYTGACGAVPAGVGSTISVSPTTTTTYFVAAVGTCALLLAHLQLSMFKMDRWQHPELVLQTIIFAQAKAPPSPFREGSYQLEQIGFGMQTVAVVAPL